MGAEHVRYLHGPPDDEYFDGETSAALLRWLETGLGPEEIDGDEWERWIDGDCREILLDADGEPITPAMLGRWAQRGSLR